MPATVTAGQGEDDNAKGGRQRDVSIRIPPFYLLVADLVVGTARRR